MYAVVRGRRKGRVRGRSFVPLTMRTLPSSTSRDRKRSHTSYLILVHLNVLGLEKRSAPEAPALTLCLLLRRLLLVRPAHPSDVLADVTDEDVFKLVPSARGDSTDSLVPTSERKQASAPSATEDGPKRQGGGDVHG